LLGLRLLRPLYLEPLDRRLEATGLIYARFMDDWVILAPTRWSLRRAVRIVNQTLQELRVEQHPDKTFIGRIERGFTFLGYWITKHGVTGIAPSTWQAFQERVARLYEQNAPPEIIWRSVELYVRRWWQWVRSGVGESRDGVNSIQSFSLFTSMNLPLVVDPGGDGVSLSPARHLLCSAFFPGQGNFVRAY
jgi:hypothetical protein